MVGQPRASVRWISKDHADIKARKEDVGVVHGDEREDGCGDAVADEPDDRCEVAVGTTGCDGSSRDLSDYRNPDDNDERAPQQALDETELLECSVGDRIHLIDVRDVSQSDPSRERVRKFRRGEQKNAGDGQGAPLETGKRRPFRLGSYSGSVWSRIASCLR